MHLSSRTLLLLMPSYLAGAASSSSAAGWPTGSSSGWGKISSGSERQAPALPCLEYYFTGIFEVAGGLKPIPVVGGGGVRVVEPIIGGRISGPAINATVKGGVAYPNVFDNGNLQDAFITTYGTTREGEAFLVQVVGVGKPSEQFSRIHIEAGGKAEKLAKDYILASLVPSADRKTVTVKGYKVSQ